MMRMTDWAYAHHTETTKGKRTMKNVLKKLKKELKAREKQVAEWRKELAQELRNSADEIEQGFYTVGFLTPAVDKVHYIVRGDSRISTLLETIRMMEGKENIPSVMNPRRD